MLTNFEPDPSSEYTRRPASEGSGGSVSIDTSVIESNTGDTNTSVNNVNTSVIAATRGATQCSFDAGAVTTTAGTISAARPTRRSITIKNESETATIWLGAGGVTPGTGFEIGPGEAATIATTIAIVGVSDEVDSPISSFEEYD